jgi:selenocysteine lyase/cysteine desulfurase
MGLGIFYVAPGREELLAPAMVGWRSMVNEEELAGVFRFKAGAGRFEPGTLDIASIAAYGGSLSLLAEVGAPAVRDAIFAVVDLLRAGLAERGLPVVSPMGPGERSSILSFPHPDAAGLYQHFMSNRVFVSPRGGRIRLAPHFYNDATDVARFFEILDAYCWR